MIYVKPSVVAFPQRSLIVRVKIPMVITLARSG